MKRFLILFPLIWCAICSAAPKYVVHGTVSVADRVEGMVYVKTYPIGENKAGILVDSAVVKNGRFELRGAANPSAMYLLWFNMGAKKQAPQVYFVPEAGTMTMTVDERGGTVAGTPVNDAFYAYSRGWQRQSASQQQFKGTTKEEHDVFLAELKIAQRKQYETDRDFAIRNINNPFGQLIATSKLGMLEFEDLREMIGQASPATMQSPLGQAMSKRYDILNQVAAGKQYTDFTMMDPEGNPVALSDFVGKSKYVLLDFWASWCGPCGALMPHMIELYSQYGDKGLQIVGISLDHNMQEWQQAMARWKLPWPQISELKARESECVKFYGVNSIPHTVLLDQDGRIIASGLKGSDLDAKFAELMK